MKEMITDIRAWLMATGEFVLPKTIVIFDTETTGFPSEQKGFDDPTQARCVQLGAIVVRTGDWKIINSIDTVIEVPSVPEPVAQIHGINTEMSHDYGVREAIAGLFFSDMCRDAPIMAFNFPFDYKIMRCVYARSEVEHPFGDDSPNPFVCLMKGSKDYAKVPVTDKQRARGMTGYKDPNLQEAYKALVDPDGFENAHSAMADVTASLAVFIEIVNLIVDELEEEV